MGTYWNRTGKYEDLMRRVTDTIQSTMGTAGVMPNSKEGNAIRAMLWLQRVYYDSYNNGWCTYKKEEPIYKNFQMHTSPYLRSHKIRYTSFEKLYKDYELLENVLNEAVLCVARDLRVLR